DDLVGDEVRTAGRVLEISLAELATTAPGGATARRDYLSLASFPPDMLITYAMLGTLWQLDQTDVRLRCDAFAKRSLLGGVEDGGVRLHDVLRDRLVHTYPDELRQVSRQLVELYRQRCTGGWHGLPVDAEAFLDQLAFQLVNAAQLDEL